MFNTFHNQRRRYYLTRGIEAPKHAPDAHPSYPLNQQMTPDNIEWFVYAYENKLIEPADLLAAENLAIQLATYFRKQDDLTRMTAYICLAMQHHEDRTRGSKNYQRLDLALKDKNFEWLFRRAGNMMFLGSAIADVDMEKLYIPLQSVHERSVHALATLLKAKHTLEVVDLANQHIGSDGAVILAEVFRTHPAIKTVYLGNNHIDERGIEAINTLPKNINIILGDQRISRTPFRSGVL